MKTKLKIYIAGPMTGYKDYNYPEFHKAEAFLSGEFEVLNPARNPEQKRYCDYIREALKLLVQCDAIYLLRNWERSGGASLEHRIASTLNMKMYYQQ